MDTTQPSGITEISAPALNRWFTPKRWIGSIVLACTAIFAVSIVVAKSYVAHSAIPLDEPKRVSLCRDAVWARLAGTPQPVDLKTIAGIHGFCYAQVNEEDMLADFGIRREAYLSQQVQTNILLWMVVGITFSGIILAAVQLFAGYRLAVAGKMQFEKGQGGSFDVESNKMSISSSVTGVLILAISMFFFYVFVQDVYIIKEVGHPPINSMAGTPDLTYGWATTPAAAPVVGPIPLSQNTPVNGSPSSSTKPVTNQSITPTVTPTTGTTPPVHIVGGMVGSPTSSANPGPVKPPNKPPAKQPAAKQ